MKHPLSTALADIDGNGTFAVSGKLSADALRLEVRGIGPIAFPVTRLGARTLCLVARPALHGKRDQTLLDRRVRDTWQIPRSRVKLDPRWNEALGPALEQIRAGLGLPSGRRLKATLHDLLVYAPGQFFLPHQDSEKDDAMIGTLVVTLPSRFEGGAMIVEHHDRRRTFRETGRGLSYAAFYADCRHQVRPVKDGYRIVLTYELSLAGQGSAEVPLPASEQIDAVEREVRRFFRTRPPPRWSGDRAELPDRLVYLLDHEYSQRSLGWTRLKGTDAVRVAVLREVARRMDCEIFLSLADVHEIWGCEEEWDRQGRFGGRGRSWKSGYREHHDDDEEDDDDDCNGFELDDEDDTPPLTDLQDSGVELRHFIDPSGKQKPGSSQPRDIEIVYTKASVDMHPFQSQHEGYMGNWGNTVERWYHRAAVVMWPRENTFVMRARMSASWAIGEINKAFDAGRVAEARDKVDRVLPFWADSARNEADRGLLAATLAAATLLDSSAVAASLLDPFRIEQMTVGAAPALVAAAERYGRDWYRKLLAVWSPDRAFEGSDARLHWLTTLPSIVEALRATSSKNADLPDEIARSIVSAKWAWLVDQYRSAARLPPSEVSKALQRFDACVLALLEAGAPYPELCEKMLGFLASGDCPVLALVQLLQTAQPARRGRVTRRGRVKQDRDDALGAVRAHCASELAQRLATPQRSADDWSIAMPEKCTCALCAELARFLADRKRTHLGWPLAKERRAHVHRALDAHELPVTHVTRRSGSPYTLVLEKTRALFDREAKERAAWQRAIDWLRSGRTTRPAPQLRNRLPSK